MLSQPQGHSAGGRIMSMKNSNGKIGNRTRDLPTCSAMPQPTALPCAPALRFGLLSALSDSFCLLFSVVGRYGRFGVICCPHLVSWRLKQQAFTNLHGVISRKFLYLLVYYLVTLITQVYLNSLWNMVPTAQSNTVIECFETGTLIVRTPGTYSYHWPLNGKDVFLV